MAQKQLTSKYYEALTEPGYHFDGRNGLYLQVSLSGSKSWICRFSFGGKSYEQGLGSFPGIGVAEARRKAAAKRSLLDQGIRPLGRREEDKQRRQAEAAARSTGKTFKECAEAYIAAHASGWRNKKHADQWRNTLKTYAYPVIGDLPVSAVSVSQVSEILEPIWTSKTETATRVRGRIESVLDWATVRGFRSGENPARWRGHLDQLFPKRRSVQKVKHHGALPYERVPDFVAALRTVSGVSAAALEFTILTAARTGESLKAKWSEFSLEGDDPVWVVPAERMKAGREHRVPLSGRAVEILRSMKKINAESDYVFASPMKEGGEHLSDMALLVLVKRLAGEKMTTHGFRSSFRDWSSEKTSHPHEVAEMALAHTVKNQVEAAYRRGDLLGKRRSLMQAWSDYCGGAAGQSKNDPISTGAQLPAAAGR